MGAGLVLYNYPCADSLPLLPGTRATYFGTSPRYLLELEKASVRPSLPHLRMVNTTGATVSTLLPYTNADQFDQAINPFMKEERPNGHKSMKKDHFTSRAIH